MASAEAQPGRPTARELGAPHVVGERVVHGIATAARMLRLLRLIKALAGRPWLARLLGAYIARKIVLLHDAAVADALNVLVFSAYRFSEDVERLGSHPKLRLYSINQRYLQLVNTLFKLEGKIENPTYYLEDDPEILELRRRNRAFAAIVLRQVARRHGIDCAVTPSILYKVEQQWAGAAVDAGVPFVGLHKEFTIIDDRHVGGRIDRYIREKTRFNGSAIFVTNRLGERLFAEGGVFPADRIRQCGLMRMDNLFRGEHGRSLEERKAAPQVTLFSFGHFSGGIQPRHRRSHYFSKHDDEGFVRLFDRVHAGIAQLAVELPHVQFKIKPKNYEDWWLCEIGRACRAELGLDLHGIANLSIVRERAPDLIGDSLVVVGLNSTVLLESAAMCRNTIVPRYEEALGRHREHVYLEPFLDAFNVAESHEAFLDLVRNGVAVPEDAQLSDPARRREMLEYYFHRDDGRALDRVVDGLLDVCGRREVAQ